MADAGVRVAAEGDVDLLVEIHLEARDTYYRGVVPDAELDDPAERAALRTAYTKSVRAEDRLVLVVDRDTTVAGFASIGPPFPDEPVQDGDPAAVSQLVGLYVRPLYWSAGIGGALLAECVRTWRAGGIRTARLEVWGGNDRAAAFYQRRGWRPDGYDRPGPGGHPYLRLTLEV